MKEFLESIYNFFVVNDFPTLLESIRGLEWKDVVRNAYVWLIGLPIIVILAWRKKTKVFVALLSFILFLVLIQHTLAPPGVQMPLKDLLTFFAGAMVIIGINVYFLFIRD